MGTRAAILLLALPALPGCAATETEPDSGAPAKAAPVELAITSPHRATRTRASTIAVRGRVTPGSRVRIAGRSVKVEAGRFQRRVRLRVGRNRIVIRAVGSGGDGARKTVVVTRRNRPKPLPRVVATPSPTPTPTPTPKPTPTPRADCDPSYKGACLDPDSADYDCAGGSGNGNGPDYTGTVTVVGDDHFDLDRDGDGTGCD